MVIKEFINKETGMSSRVEQLPSGRLKVSLKDDDAGQVVRGTTVTYPASMLESAIARAEDVMK